LKILAQDATEIRNMAQVKSSVTVCDGRKFEQTNDAHLYTIKHQTPKMPEHSFPTIFVMISKPDE
jgi:hypothetical protein